MPQTLSVSWSLVVTRITGMCFVLGSRVIERVAWKPLRFGITTSIRSRSGSSRLATSTPAAPSSAVSASWPRLSTMRRMPISCDGESSTIRMRAVVFPVQFPRLEPAGGGLQAGAAARLAFSQRDQRATVGTAGQHALEDLRQRVECDFASADPLEVARLPVAGQAAPDLVAD